MCCLVRAPVTLPQAMCPILEVKGLQTLFQQLPATAAISNLSLVGLPCTPGKRCWYRVKGPSKRQSGTTQIALVCDPERFRGRTGTSRPERSLFASSGMCFVSRVALSGFLAISRGSGSGSRSLSSPLCGGLWLWSGSSASARPGLGGGFSM